MVELTAALRTAAAAPILLVACDFDGTLSPIAPRPDLAAADAEDLAALRAISAMPRSYAAVISGRSLADLRRFLHPVDGLKLVGSHGAEGEDLPTLGLSSEQAATLSAAVAAAERLSAGVPGSIVEGKPFGVAFHFRLAEPAAGRQAAQELAAWGQERADLEVLPGHMVVELKVSGGGKGAALAHLRRRVGAAAVIFVGDDITDEDAFRALGATDVGIRIGVGESAARHIVETREAVGELLSAVATLRREAISVGRAVPIQRHALLSDQRTIALVDPRARVSWLCLPRIDSPAIFAELLNGPGGGFFEVAPVELAGEAVQTYVPDTFVLRTDFGGVSVTDYFDCTGGRPYQRAGRSDLVRVIEGRGLVRVRFAPRLDFGRVATRLVLRDGGVEVEGWTDPIALHAPGVKWRLEDDGRHHTAIAELDPMGVPIVLALRYGLAALRGTTADEPVRRAGTERFWSGWAGALRVPARHEPLLRRSALVIKALCHGPTGGIAAAATTSLPAPIGAGRNWDYRYCWPRDAALAAASLLRLGNTGVAMKLLDWFAEVVEGCETPDRLRPIYTVAGTHLGPEAELTDLQGYAGSRPVRIGNAAAYQVQLDIFAPIVDLVRLMLQQDSPVTPQYWRLVEQMVAAVAARWEEPDHGIWEIRDRRRQYVYSKVMCWRCVNSAIKVGEQFDEPTPGWGELRERIAADVLANGYNAAVGAFTNAYGEPHLDTASLHVGLSGLLAPDDPRFVSTVDAVSRELRSGAVVYRYHYDDALPGIEGGFHICTAWLIEALLLTGRRAEAEELFERMAALASPLGLLSEQHEPRHGEAMGNFPQAYSHLGLIDAACALWPG